MQSSIDVSHFACLVGSTWASYIDFRTFWCSLELLNRMSSDNVEEVTAEILGSKLIDELRELAEQVDLSQNS